MVRLNLGLFSGLFWVRGGWGVTSYDVGGAKWRRLVRSGVKASPNRARATSDDVRVTLITSYCVEYRRMSPNVAEWRVVTSNVVECRWSDV